MSFLIHDDVTSSLFFSLTISLPPPSILCSTRYSLEGRDGVMKLGRGAEEGCVGNQRERELLHLSIFQCVSSVDCPPPSSPPSD